MDHQASHIIFHCRSILCIDLLERVAGIEPAYSAWKAAALPLSYTRNRQRQIGRARAGRQSRSGDNLVCLVPHACSRAVGPETQGRKDGGGGWIRTSVGLANGFTVRLL